MSFGYNFKDIKVSKENNISLNNVKYCMRIISWNVSGLRAILNKGFMSFVKKENPDIICLQETKVDDKFQINIPGYINYINNGEKKGYSGTAIFTKIKPIKYSFGKDKEGRVISLEFSKFVLVNVYTPNSQRGLTRLDYRMKWDKEFLEYLEKFEKPVIVCGDFNVAHKEIDLANPKANRRNAGFTDEERDNFTKLLGSGFIDTFREFNDKPGQYSFWVYFANARAKNVGWRIDYFLVSKNLKSKLKDAFILNKVIGSDHCPIGLEIE